MSNLRNAIRDAFCMGFFTDGIKDVSSKSKFDWSDFDEERECSVYFSKKMLNEPYLKLQVEVQLFDDKIQAMVSLWNGVFEQSHFGVVHSVTEDIFLKDPRAFGVVVRSEARRLLEDYAKNIHDFSGVL